MTKECHAELKLQYGMIYACVSFFPFFPLALKVHRATFYRQALNQTGPTISIQYGPHCQKNNLNLGLAVLLAIHSRTIKIKEVLKWSNKITLLYGMLCEDNGSSLALSVQVLWEDG